MMRLGYVVLAYLVSASVLASAIGHALYQRNTEQGRERLRQQLLDELSNP